MVITKTNESKGSFSIRGTKESISKIIAYLKAFYLELYPEFIVSDLPEEDKKELPSIEFLKDWPFAESIEYEKPSRIFKRSIIKQISEFNKFEGIFCRHEFEIPKIWIYSYQTPDFDYCVEKFKDMINEEFSISKEEYFWKIQNKAILKYIKKEYKSEMEKIKKEIPIKITFEFECDTPPEDATVFKVKTKAKSFFEQKDEWTYVKVTIEINKNKIEYDYLTIIHELIKNCNKKNIKHSLQPYAHIIGLLAMPKTLRIDNAPNPSTKSITSQSTNKKTEMSILANFTYEQVDDYWIYERDETGTKVIEDEETNEYLSNVFEEVEEGGEIDIGIEKLTEIIKGKKKSKKKKAKQPEEETKEESKEETKEENKEETKEETKEEIPITEFKANAYYRINGKVIDNPNDELFQCASKILHFEEIVEGEDSQPESYIFRCIPDCQVIGDRIKIKGLVKNLENLTRKE